MKRKFEIYNEPCVDENGYPVRKIVKSFKNEPEAKAFYSDQKNLRRYGTMYMYKNTSDGLSYAWDDRKGEWISA